MSMFFERLTTYVDSTTPAIKAADLNAIQDQAALLARLLVTGRRITDDFLSSTLSTQWLATVTGSASATHVGNDAVNDGAGAIALEVGAGASSIDVATSEIPINTRDFYLYFRARHVAGTSYNYTFGLTSNTSANNCRVLVSSGGAGAMTVGVGTGGSGVSITPTLGATYSDFVFSRVAGALVLTVNGSLAYSTSFATSLTDAYLDLFNGAGAADTVYVDTATLLVDQ